jgi:hypothetical protein
MALSAFVAGDSLEDIVNDCERIASNPGLNLDPATKLPPVDGSIKNAPAYRWLLSIIRHLYLEQDWPFAIQARTLSFASERCLLLPDDFWRVAYKDPLYGLVENLKRIAPKQVTRPQFFDNDLLIQKLRTGQPSTFYIDRAAALVYLDPIPDQAYAWELHYFRLIEELTSITEIPQFPYRDYLKQALLVRYYEDQDDSRITNAEQVLAVMFGQIRQAAYDTREEPQTLETGMLDPQYFRVVNYED